MSLLAKTASGSGRDRNSRRPARYPPFLVNGTRTHRAGGPVGVLERLLPAGLALVGAGSGAGTDDQGNGVVIVDGE